MQTFLLEHQFSFVRSYPLSARCTLGVGGSGFAIFPRCESELCALIDFFDEGNDNYVVLGRMSNTLPPVLPDRFTFIFTDRLQEVSVEDGTLLVGAGVSLPSLITRLSRDRIYMYPELCGIPGSIGGAVYGNAGAFSAEIADHLLYADCYDARVRKMRRLTKAELSFCYRYSVLKEGALYLIRVCFSLGKQMSERVFLSVREEVKKKREKTQPKAPSLGSVFQRCDGVAVSRLLDMAGQKGRRFGGIGLSEKHAGFLINLGGGTVTEYQNAVSKLSDVIRNEFGFSPKPEIKIM